MSNPREYYLNDFPRPFVSADGEPDFAVVFGRDSRDFLIAKGGRFTITHREEMTWADITDACGFAEIAFLLGQFSHSLPQKRVHVANWLRESISELTIDQNRENPNLIIVGSAKVNAKAKYYQEKCKDQLVLEVIHDQTCGEPKALKYKGKKIYNARRDHDVGLVQIAENPESGKAILFLQGFYGKGTYGACVALARKLDEIQQHNNVRACVVEAYSSGELGDMLDEVKILDVFIDRMVDDLEVPKGIENQKIFFSYAREDEEKVEDLYQKLSDAGCKPWMDKKDILPGERWELAIQEAIRCSDFFLVCLSKTSVDKRGWIQREIRKALDVLKGMLDRDIYLIPIRLEDCEVPESLRDFQWVDLFEKDGWTRLVKAIQVGMERRAEIKPAVVERVTRRIRLDKDK